MYESHRITIQAEAQGWPNNGQSAPATYEIKFGDITNDHVRCNLAFSTPDHKIEFGCMFYGINIFNFANELEQLHQKLEGSARLNNWDNEPLLCLTVVDSARGYIAMGGEIRAAIHWTDIRSEDNFIDPPMYGYAAGIRVSFEGLMIDQSYLPAMIRDAREFLNDTGISTEGPQF